MNAGEEFLTAYELQRSRSLLDSAIDVLRLGTSLNEGASAERLAALNALGIALAWRWEEASDPADLGAAIDAFAQAAELTPPGPDRCGSLTNLGSALLERIEHAPSGETAQDDISRAIAALQSALAECPDAESAPYRLYHLAGAFLAREAADSGHQAESAALADLEMAEQATQQGIDAIDADPANPWHSRLLRRRGDIWHTRWQYTGNPQALGLAIEAYRDAVLAAGEDLAVRAGYLSALGGSLMEVFDLTGALSYLEGAGGALTCALEDTPEDDPDFTAHLSNVALVHGSVAQATGDPGRMDEAVRLHRRALELDEPPTPLHGMLLGRYGAALVDSVSLLDRAADTGPGDSITHAYLDEAVAALRAAAELGGQDQRAASIKNNLGNALVLRAEHTAGTEDLTEAVRCFEGALAASQDTAQDTIYLTGLGGAWRLLYSRTGDETARRAGVTAYRQACAADQAPGRPALGAVANWGAWETILGNWLGAAQAYERFMDIAEALVGGQTMRTHQQAWLQDVHEIPAQAGYAWLRCGEPGLAAAAVERGRVVLLRHLINAAPEPSDKSAPADSRPGPFVNDALLGARDAGDALRLAILTPEPADIIAARIQDALQLIPRPDPPRSPVAGSLRPVAEDRSRGAIVYLCPCDPEGFLLAVAGNGDVTTSRRLPSLTRGTLRSTAITYFDAYDRRHADLASWERELDTITAWLWDSCIGPLLECIPAAEHVTIVAGGLLSLLPVHAAWTRDDTRASGRRYLIDETAVAYAPSRSLLHSRGTDSGPGALLAVSDPQPSRQRPLPWAEWETNAISGYFERAVTRIGNAATVDACLHDLGDLRQGDVFHAACHGRAAPDSPFHASLLLADDQELSLGMFFGRPDVAGRLAVLSACETSLPGVDLPEEALAFPTAFLQIGFTGAVAGQWAIPETPASAALVAEFYRRWRLMGREPRQALREAQCWLRDATNGEKADAFPDLFLPPPLPEPALSFWRRARAHLSPRHWASLTYWGS